MSSLQKNKFTIVLFQAGLGDNETDFIQTINKLTNGFLTTIAYKDINKSTEDSFIDMSKFNCENNTFYGLDINGYLGKSASLMNDFRKQIANLVDTSKRYANKSVLVRTSLGKGVNFNDVYDSIENQRKKLLFIIDSIKSYDIGINIILVGHSQGGLVNLEAAIERPNSIYKLVSISTPYSPVSLANNLVILNFLAKPFKINVYKEMVSDEGASQRFKSCVEKLNSGKYFSNLKDKWNKLNSRPELIVIAGVSGHLSSVTTSVDYFTERDIVTITKKSFDGLVSIAEQTDIKNATFYKLSDRSLPCYGQKNSYADSICYISDGYSFSCNKKCLLSSFSLVSTELSILFDNLWDIIFKGKNFDVFNHPIVADIYNGRFRLNINDTKNQKYYDVYASDYSHMWLRYCNETIGILLSAMM